MKQQMMEIGRWIKAHPLKGTLWLLVFVGVAACAALFERYELALGAVFFLLLMPFAVFYRRDVTKLKAVALILAAAVFLNALPAHAAEPPQPPQRVGCAVVIVVIIGIGIVTYFVVKKMAKIKPKAPPKDDDGNAVGYILTSGSWCYEGDCDEGEGFSPAAVTDEPTMTVFCNISPGNALTVSSSPGTLTDEEFLAATHAEGINIERPGQTFGVNQQPVNYNPYMHFTQDTNGVRGVVVDFGTPTRRVRLEKSEDLVHWRTIAQAEIPEWMPLTVPEVTAKRAAFYRASAY